MPAAVVGVEAVVAAAVERLAAEVAAQAERQEAGVQEAGVQLVLERTPLRVPGAAERLAAASRPAVLRLQPSPSLPTLHLRLRQSPYQPIASPDSSGSTPHGWQRSANSIQLGSLLRDAPTFKHFAPQ
jgi:hypothetical protein